MSKFGTPKCVVCQKPVYPADSATIDGHHAVHKSSCLKCTTCGKSLSVDMAAMHAGKLYCSKDVRVARGEAPPPRSTSGANMASPARSPPTGSLASPGHGANLAPPARSQSGTKLAPPPSTLAVPGAATSGRQRPPSQSLQGNMVRLRAAAAPAILPQGVGGATMPLSKAVFKKYAQDRPGLSPQEFQVMCLEMGYMLTDQELDMAIKMLDEDHSGVIEYDEFLHFWKSDSRFQKLQLSEEKLIELNEMFRMFISFDADGSGTIDKDEWHNMHTDLAQRGYSKTTAEKEWESIDIDGSGFVSFNEFVDWLVPKMNK